MITRALIYIQSGRVSPDKQERICVQYATEKQWEYAIMRRGPLAEAVRLVEEGHAHVLLAAFEPDDAADLERDVSFAGGRVVYVRRQPLPRKTDPPGHNTDDIVAIMGKRGGTTGEITRLLGVEPGRVRRVLQRLGVRRRG